MIKVKIGNNLLLGIDKENVKRLKEGEPIKVNGADLGMKEDIYIAYGDTISDIQKEFNLPSVQ